MMVVVGGGGGEEEKEEKEETSPTFLADCVALGPLPVAVPSTVGPWWNHWFSVSL